VLYRDCVEPTAANRWINLIEPTHIGLDVQERGPVDHVHARETDLGRVNSQNPNEAQADGINTARPPGSPNSRFAEAGRRVEMEPAGG